MKTTNTIVFLLSALLSNNYGLVSGAPTAPLAVAPLTNSNHNAVNNANNNGNNVIAPRLEATVVNAQQQLGSDTRSSADVLATSASGTGAGAKPKPKLAVVTAPIGQARVFSSPHHPHQAPLSTMVAEKDMKQAWESAQEDQWDHWNLAATGNNKNKRDAVDIEFDLPSTPDSNKKVHLPLTSTAVTTSSSHLLAARDDDDAAQQQNLQHQRRHQNQHQQQFQFKHFQLRKGDMTYYDVGLGSCGYDDSGRGDTDNIVAISASLMTGIGHNPAWCGRQIRITGAGGQEVTATVRDKCMGCPEGGIDVSPKVFREVAGDLGLGRTVVSWSFLN